MQRDIGWVSRKEPRELKLRGSLCLREGHSIPMNVANASRAGCEVHLTETLSIAETAILECAPHGVASAKVRWELPGRAALRFIEG
jgi:hypothetical protein